MNLNYKGLYVERIAHDCFRISKDKVLYTDPFKIKKELHDADYIIISHEHFDHLSIEDLKKIVKKGSKIIAPHECIGKLNHFEDIQIIPLNPGDKKAIDENLAVVAIPAYNTNKFRAPGIPFHPKEDEKAGYIFKFLGIVFYLAGDTDFIPEMKKIKCNIAFLPVSGTYVMTAEEGAKAAEAIDAEIYIPMHYNTIVGSISDAEKFKRLLAGKKRVEIL